MDDNINYARHKIENEFIDIDIVQIIFGILMFSTIATIVRINYNEVRVTLPKRRLLTAEEYNKEAQDFTAKQLEELKVYCMSSKCNAWKLISRLNRPDR